GFGESVCLLTGFQCLDTMPATEMPTSAAEWALLATSTPMLAGPIMIQTGATSAAGRLRRALPAVIAFFAIPLGYAEAAPEPTFNREVVRILQQHCQECHRAGGSAPFPLITYDQAFRRRQKILETTSGRTMPPWRPVAGYGEFVGARRLAPEDIATI